MNETAGLGVRILSTQLPTSKSVHTRLRKVRTLSSRQCLCLNGILRSKRVVILERTPATSFSQDPISNSLHVSTLTYIWTTTFPLFPYNYDQKSQDMSVFISSGPFKNIQNQELVVTTDLILRHGTLQMEVISPYHMQRTSLVTKTNPAESPLWRLSIQQTKTKKEKRKSQKFFSSHQHEQIMRKKVPSP